MGWLCCFCDTPVEFEEMIRILGSWGEEDDQREQFWAAHRNCFVNALGPEAREHYGPRFDDD